MGTGLSQKVYSLQCLFPERNYRDDNTFMAHLYCSNMLVPKRENWTTEPQAHVNPEHLYNIHEPFIVPSKTSIWIRAYFVDPLTYTLI